MNRRRDDEIAVQIGMTPRYLDPRCHEALYEVDVGAYGACEWRDRDDADRRGSSRNGLPMDESAASVPFG